MSPLNWLENIPQSTTKHYLISGPVLHKRHCHLFHGTLPFVQQSFEAAGLSSWFCYNWFPEGSALRCGGEGQSEANAEVLTFSKMSINHNTARPLACPPRRLPAAVGVTSPSLRWFISVKRVGVLIRAVWTVGKEGALHNRRSVEINNVVNAIVVIDVSSPVFWTRFTYVMFCVAACYFS